MLERFREVAGVEIREREVAVARAVGRVLANQRAEVLDRLFVILRDREVVRAYGPVFLALRHPVQQRECFLVQLVGLVVPSQGELTHRPGRIGASEIRIDFGGPPIVGDRFFVFAVRAELLSNTVFLRRLEGSRGKGFCLGEPFAFRGHVTQVLTDIGSHAGNCLQNVLLVPRRPARGCQNFSFERVYRAQVHSVALPLARDRPGENHFDSLALRNEAGILFVELVDGGALRGAGSGERVSPREGRDERRPLHRDCECLLERPFEHGILRVVAKIGNQDRERIACWRRCRDRLRSRGQQHHCEQYGRARDEQGDRCKQRHLCGAWPGGSERRDESRFYR
jgi:hypothetical protein